MTSIEGALAMTGFFKPRSSCDAQSALGLGFIGFRGLGFKV